MPVHFAGALADAADVLASARRAGQSFIARIHLRGTGLPLHFFFLSGHGFLHSQRKVASKTGWARWLFLGGPPNDCRGEASAQVPQNV
jgi:hypothetical protein